MNADIFFVLNGAIPFILALVPVERSGLGIGMYYGGFGAGISFFDLILPKIGAMTPVLGGIGGAITFAIAAICIIMSQRIKTNPS